MYSIEANSKSNIARPTLNWILWWIVQMQALAQSISPVQKTSCKLIVLSYLCLKIKVYLFTANLCHSTHITVCSISILLCTHFFWCFPLNKLLLVKASTDVLEYSNSETELELNPKFFRIIQCWIEYRNIRM